MTTILCSVSSSRFPRWPGLLGLCLGLTCLAAFSLQADDQGKTAVAKPVLAASAGNALPDAQVPTYVSKEPITVTLKCSTPGAVIRYSVNGTTPADAFDGIAYEEPIKIEKNDTIVAIAFKEGMAPSPRVFATYLVGEAARPALNSLHIGNSLTNTTYRFADMARTAGHNHQYRSLTAPGALTQQLWDVELRKQKNDWNRYLTELGRIDHLTVQPRDFDLAREVAYDIKFFNLVWKKSPEVQPWLYCEWVEKKRSRPTDNAQVPSSQMKHLYPALTWEESMGAMLLYVEELHAKILKSYEGKKRPRIIPSAIALGIVSDMMERGRFPDLKVKAEGGNFYSVMFKDDVHLNENGAFLIDCTWYAAFYGESPEDKVLPIGTKLTAAQARVMQQVAWNVVKNYPESGLFEEGTIPVDKPKFSSDSMPIKSGLRLEMSAMPSTLIRYTLDGTTPTRNRGYVYCGIISARPGMTVKAVAIKSGMADSPVASVTFPAK